MSTRGGAANISGICFQMLKAIDDLREMSGVSIYCPNKGKDCACIVLEPSGGGDAARLDGAATTVIQVKLRGKELQFHDFVSSVLVDFLRAMSTASGPVTIFELQTAFGIEHQQTWERFFVRILRAELATDEIVFGKLRFSSDQDLLESIKTRVDKAFKHTNTSLLEIASVLSRCQFAEPKTEEEIAAKIDTFLAEHHPPDQLIEKRRALIGWLTQRAASGDAVIKVSEFQSAAGWSVWTFKAISKLSAKLLNERRIREIGADWFFQNQHYVSRDAIAQESSLVLITGKSGFGKSWEVEAQLQNRLKNGALAISLSASDIATFDSSASRRVWVEAMGKSAEISLRNLSEFARCELHTKGFWLTIGIPDTLSQAQVNQLCHAIPEGYGVRVIAAVDDRVRLPASACKIMLPAFTHLQLHDYFERRGFDDSTLPSDVRNLLTTPLFARLFADLHASAFRPSNEYELVGRAFNVFWDHLAPEQRDFELVSLILCSDLEYPWLLSTLKGRGISLDSLTALRKSGLLNVDTDDRWAFSHDRLLNWYVARGLSQQLLSNALDANGLVAQILPFWHRSDLDDARPSTQPLLGYILMDVIWLLSQSSFDSAATFCHCWIETAESTDAHMFMEDLFSTLGATGLPLLNILDKDPPHKLLSHWTWIQTQVIREIGKNDSQQVAAFVVERLRSVDIELVYDIASLVAEFPSKEAAPFIHRYLAEVSLSDAQPRVVGTASELRRALRSCLPFDDEWVDKQIESDLQNGTGIDAAVWVNLLTKSYEPFADFLWPKHRQSLLETLPSVHADLMARAALRFSDENLALSLIAAPVYETSRSDVFAALSILTPKLALSYFREHCEDISHFNRDASAALLLFAFDSCNCKIDELELPTQKILSFGEMLSGCGDRVTVETYSTLLDSLLKVLCLQDPDPQHFLIKRRIQAISETHGFGAINALAQYRNSALASKLACISTPAPAGTLDSPIRGSARALLRRIGGPHWNELLRVELCDLRAEVRERALSEDLVGTGVADLALLLPIAMGEHSNSQGKIKDSPVAAALHLLREGHVLTLLDQALPTLARISLRSWHRRFPTQSVISATVVERLGELLSSEDSEKIAVALAIVAFAQEHNLVSRIPANAFDGKYGSGVAVLAFFALRFLKVRNDSAVVAAIRAVEQRFEWCDEAACYVSSLHETKLDQQLDVSMGDKPIGNLYLIDVCIELVRRGNLEKQRHEFRRAQLWKMRHAPFLDHEDIYTATLDPASSDGHEALISDLFASVDGVSIGGQRAAQIRRLISRNWTIATRETLLLVQKNHHDAPWLIQDVMAEDPARALDEFSALIRASTRRDHLRRIGIEVERHRQKLDATIWLLSLFDSPERDARRNACFIAGFAISAACDEKLIKVIRTDPCLSTRAVALLSTRSRARTRHAEEMIAKCNAENAFVILMSAFTLSDPALLFARHDVKSTTSSYLSEFQRQQLDDLLKRRTDETKKQWESNSWPTL